MLAPIDEMFADNLQTTNFVDDLGIESFLTMQFSLQIYCLVLSTALKEGIVRL